jgi:hypothetical protein
MKFLAEHKGMHHGCKGGILALEPSSVVFSCPTDQNRSLSVDLAQVKGVDHDGIEAFRNEKFHFKIAGRNEEELHQLFLDWKARVVVGQGAP